MTAEPDVHRTAPLYDAIASFYDPWSVSVTEDVGFYVREAVASGGPVVELAVGTGRIAIPIAVAGIPVIGVDQSPGMLEVARAYAEREGVAHDVDLRLGDLRTPPVAEISVRKKWIYTPRIFNFFFHLFCDRCFMVLLPFIFWND